MFSCFPRCQRFIKNPFILLISFFLEVLSTMFYNVFNLSFPSFFLFSIKKLRHLKYYWTSKRVETCIVIINIKSKFQVNLNKFLFISRILLESLLKVARIFFNWVCWDDIYIPWKRKKKWNNKVIPMLPLWNIFFIFSYDELFTSNLRWQNLVKLCKFFNSI